MLTGRAIFTVVVLLAVLLAAPNALAGTLKVALGESVQAALDRARDGDVVELAPGVHRGGLVVRRRVTLRGAPGAILDGEGNGTVLRVAGAFARVEDLAIRGSGRDLGAPDCGVFVEKSATRAVVQRVAVEVKGFGIWINETEAAEVLDCRVTGSLEGNRPERGNAIHLFDGSHLVVRGNTIVGGRDGIYVSATDDSLIEDNDIQQTRYGVHYMYAQRNTVRRNRASHNLTGITLMMSQGIKAIDNESTENEEYGFLLRDIEDCEIVGNRSVGNELGLFFYGSTDNVLKRNLIRDNAIGFKIWGGCLRNQITENAFIGNRMQVFFVASEDLVLGEAETGNYWSDYLGWDQNGDGMGDRPYRVDGFTNHLLYQYPSAVLLLRSPALELLAHLEERLPLLRVPTVIDLRPLSRTTLR
jgi:nitrous oxidase accessory protein